MYMQTILYGQVPIPKLLKIWDQMFKITVENNAAFKYKGTNVKTTKKAVYIDQKN